MTRLEDTKGDQWNELAELYKKLTVETSHRPIGVMLERANALLPFSKASGILDNGCGPGPVLSRLLKDYQVPESCSFTCSDFSEGMIKQVQQTKQEAIRADSKSPWNRVETVVQNAMDLQSVENSSVSHVTAGWVYFMTPDPQKCLSESKRVLKDGGVLTCSSWQGSQWMDLMNLLPQVKPEKTMPKIPDAWTDAELMKAELEKAGFKDVESHQVPTTMQFDKLASLVDFMITKMPHMVMLTKDFSKEEMAKLEELMTAEGKKMNADEPGVLTGTALVAVGKK